MKLKIETNNGRDLCKIISPAVDVLLYLQACRMYFLLFVYMFVNVEWSILDWNHRLSFQTSDIVKDPCYPIIHLMCGVRLINNENKLRTLQHCSTKLWSSNTTWVSIAADAVFRTAGKSLRQSICSIVRKLLPFGQNT